MSDAQNQLETEETRALIGTFHGALEQIREQVRRVIVGQDEVVEHLLVTLLVGGHCLITGMPGTAKTLLVRTLARRARAHVQAHSVHAGLDADRRHRHGHHRRGHDDRPAHAGRSCRARCSRTCCSRTRSTARRRRRSPRCSRRCRNFSVTVRGHHHAIERPFFVLATQNPIELEGTYPLPEAQLDRFLFNVLLDYLTADDELTVVDRYTSRMDLPEVNACTTPEQILQVPVARAPGAGVRRASGVMPWSWCAPRGRRIRSRPTCVRKYVQLRRERPRDAVPHARREGARADAGPLPRDRARTSRRSRCRCMRHRVLTNYFRRSPTASIPTRC